MDACNDSKVKAAIARRDSLTPERRAEIAQKAAQSRWNPTGVLATHVGILHIGDLSLDCAVLDDGRRVLSQRALSRALGRKTGGWDFRNKGEGELPAFLSLEGLKPFVSEDLRSKVSSPVLYRFPKAGGGVSHGYEASVLPQICEVWLLARQARALRITQKAIAERAELLLRGLAQVGIIAMVDEATGYQEVRDRRALEAILDKFLRKELAAWAKRFPDEFYKQVFRLKSWEWESVSSKRPGVVGKYTNDLVYERLAPSILEELEQLNPKNDKGYRKSKHHQWLTDDVGHPALSQHIYALISFMKASNTWEDFYHLVQRAFPKKNSQMLLPG